MASTARFWVIWMSTLLLGMAPFWIPEGYRPSNRSSPLQQENTPPTVQILAPENNSSFDWNSQMRYKIRVTDQEDGESEFEEIVLNEVLLEVMYLPDPSQAALYLNTDSLKKDPPGLALIRTSDCFNCHGVKSKLTGPPFAEIAKRYPHNAASINLLAGRVMKGNSGVWGSEAMPPHPGFTARQAEQIVQWILEKSDNPNRDYYPGIEGTFRTRAKPENGAGGVYLLTASYTDHSHSGTNEQGQRGQHIIMLRSKP